MSSLKKKKKKGQNYPAFNWNNPFWTILLGNFRLLNWNLSNRWWYSSNYPMRSTTTWPVSTETIQCWKWMLLIWNSLACTKSPRLLLSCSKDKPQSITLTPHHVFFIPDFIPFSSKSTFDVINKAGFLPVTNRTYCTDQIFYFPLFMPVTKECCISQNPYCTSSENHQYLLHAHFIIAMLLLSLGLAFLTWQL